MRSTYGLVVFLLTLALCSATDGQTLMQQRCSVCHSLDRITSAHKTADQWKTTVERMISHGAQLSPQEEQILIDYLAQNYK